MRRGLQARRRDGRLAPLAVAMLVAAGPTAHAQDATGTPAGTTIANTAHVDAQVSGAAIATTSSTATFTVDELLDPVLTPGPATDSPPSVILTNGGNGTEAFVVTATAADGSDVPVAEDADGDGRYDPPADNALPGGLTPPLAPGRRLKLFILTRGGAVTVRARAAAGSGAAGTVLPGAGAGGVDAVVGPTGGVATLQTAGPDAGAAPTIVKSQAVAAADGVARSGGVVTYTLIAAFPSARADARVEDAIPAGATYVPGSLRLDGAPLTDAADADAGAVTGGVAAVALGDAPAGSTHTIAFQVTLK